MTSSNRGVLGFLWFLWLFLALWLFLGVTWLLYRLATEAPAPPLRLEFSSPAEELTEDCAGRGEDGGALLIDLVAGLVFWIENPDDILQEITTATDDESQGVQEIG